jgi:hypothetical protein
MSPHESWYHYPEGEDASADDVATKTRELETT